MIKRIISFALTVILILSLLSFASGCGKKDEGPILGDNDPLGKFDPPVTLTYAQFIFEPYIQVAQNLGYTETDNMWTRAYKDELGIRLELTFGGGDMSAYMQRMTSSILMDDLPDIFSVLSGEYAYSTLRELNDSDAVADLTELYKIYASENLKRYVKAAGNEIFQPCTFGGRLKGIPAVFGAETQVYAFWWIRRDWLEALNLDVPETMDELFNAAKLFTESDPDNNDKDDTCGLALGDEFMTINGLIFNAYNSFPRTWQKDEDGKLYYGSLSQSTKAVLAKLKDLVSAGYATNPSNYLYGTMAQDAVDGKVGIIPGVISFGLNMTAAYKKNPEADFIALTVLPSEKDQKLKVTSPINSGNYFAVSKKCLHPEAILKIYNLFIEKREDPNPQTYNNYIDTIDGQAIHPIAFIASEIPGKNLAQAKTFAEHYKNGTVPERGNDKTVYTYVMKWLNDKDPDYWGWNAIYGLEGSEHLAEFYFENDVFQFSQFNAAPTDTMMLYGDYLKNLEYTAFLNIVTGQQPVDYFDAFVEEWLNAGGREITAEVNEWAAGYTPFLD